MNVAFAAVAVGYAVLLRSRRGSALLGRRTRVRQDAVSPRFALWSRVIILAVLALGIVAAFVPHPGMSVPYARTIAERGAGRGPDPLREPPPERSRLSGRGRGARTIRGA